MLPNAITKHKIPPAFEEAVGHIHAEAWKHKGSDRILPQWRRQKPQRQWWSCPLPALNGGVLDSAEKV